MKKMLLQRLWPRSMRGFVALATALCFLYSFGLPASLHAAEITIEFLPPPMEGTLSLGVYNNEGKLVRVLHREADLEDFRIALNGLVAHWDGEDDSGADCPPGRYSIRGYRVGELKIEGIDFHGNDWTTDEEAPRIAQLNRIAALPDGSLLFDAQLASAEEPQRFILAPQEAQEQQEEADEKEGTQAETKETPAMPEAPGVESAPSGSNKAAESAEATDEWRLKPAPDTAFPEATEPTSTQWSWTLRSPEGGGAPTALDVRSADGSKSYSIPLVQTGTPAPIAVSVAKDRLFLLEASAHGQELRGFDLSKRETPTTPEAPATAPTPMPSKKEPQPAQATSTPASAPPVAAPSTLPKLLFSRVILWSKEYDTVAARLKFPDGTPFAAQPQLRVALVRNPLIKKKSPMLDVQVKIDAEGAYLATSDGLPLARVSETPFLKWAVIGRPEKAKGSEIVLFESDGSTIEEYHATKLSQMMAFDAGIFTIKGKKPEPAPAASATPAAEATPEATPAPEGEPTPAQTPAATPSEAPVETPEKEGDEASAPAASPTVAMPSEHDHMRKLGLMYLELSM